jgi:hypothetical protein
LLTGPNVTVTTEPTGPELGLTERIGGTVVVFGEGVAARAGADPIANPATKVAASIATPSVDDRLVTRTR